MRTRNPAASADIGSAIQSETARHRYITAQVTKNPPNDVASCPRLRANIGASKSPDPGEDLVQSEALPDPPAAKMNSPAKMLSHRYRPLTARTEVTLAVE